MIHKNVPYKKPAIETIKPSTDKPSWLLFLIPKKPEINPNIPRITESINPTKKVSTSLKSCLINIEPIPKNNDKIPIIFLSKTRIFTNYNIKNKKN